MAPSEEQVRKIFEPLSIQGSQQEFFNSVADNVEWTILGHSPMSKAYFSKEEFAKETLQYLREKVLTEPLRIRVINVVSGDSQSDWATVEMTSIDAKCKNGMTYNMNYCWICQFDEKNTIVKVRAYLDTQLLTEAIEQNP